MKKHAILLAAFIAVSAICMIIANVIQTDGGKIDVSMGEIQLNWKNTENTMDENGNLVSTKEDFLDSGTLTFKLYKPAGVSAENPAPAVLLLHGYQNDHETSAAYAVELARRGVVVMALDEFGHGATSIGMKKRGWTNHKVKVNYGNDSDSDGTYAEIGGAQRYRLMMNFSTLSFFNDRYSKGSDGTEVADSSMGGVSAYTVLSNFDFVDPERMAVSGHSMGTWASWTVAAMLSGATDDKGRDISPKAVVLQCGELFRKSAYDSKNISFNNILLLQAKYDEFNYFRDYANTVTDDLLKTPIRTEFLGTTADKAAWNTTFGSFADGSARRIELLNTNHRLTTHHSGGMKAAMEWFQNALNLDTTVASTDQVFLIKEWLVFFAMLFGIAAMIPFMELLLCTPFFASVACGIPDRPDRVSKGKKWVRGMIITVLIAFITYPFMTQLGHGLLPLPEGIFRMTIGNGFLSWYLLLIIIMVITTWTSVRGAKKRGSAMDFADMGFAAEPADKSRTAVFSWALCGKGALLALCMTCLMYVMVLIFEKTMLLDYRFIWPFFKTFTLARFGQFCLYIPVFAVFFLMNNSKIFAQARVEDATTPGFKGFMKCWWKYALCMVGGIILLMLLEYIPFFAGLGPGVDLLFSSTFGGPFMSLMIVFVPQVLVFSVICTYVFRRTGNVFTGAICVAILACWIVTGGSAIF